jgi:hypothetical protein
MEISMEVPQKTNNKCISWCCNITPGHIYLKESKSAAYSQDSCTSMFIAALFTIVTIWNQPRCSPNDE